MKPNVVVCSKGKCPAISLFRSFDNHEERLNNVVSTMQEIRLDNFSLNIAF